MNTTKKLLSALFIAVLTAVTAFSMDVNKEISRYTAEQQILINAYKLMIDGEDDTMDSYTQDENDTLIEHLSMADGDWEILWDDLESTYDLQGNEPEAIYLRYLIDNTFKKKLDIAVLNDLAKSLKEKGLSSVKTYNAMQNPIVTFVKGLNTKSKQKNQDTLENIASMIVKFSDSDKLINTIGMALQDKAVKSYILDGNTTTPAATKHEAISDTIVTDLKNKFKADLDTNKIDTIVAQLKAKKMGDDQIIGSVENFLADFCKEVKNPKSKQKKETLEIITTLFTKLSNSDNLLQSVALTLNDTTLKDYIVNN